ncbi:hypothetical protein [Advenella mimigardefordensis]|uniref:hypothetical protein n=1 Tax=Advenella mimigardefordensis TaxID=302406 RepID=UPI00046D1329|nr:hypothetical protein [Advenella mimigardefordensis]
MLTDEQIDLLMKFRLTARRLEKRKKDRRRPQQRLAPKHKQDNPKSGSPQLPKSQFGPILAAGRPEWLNKGEHHRYFPPATGEQQECNQWFKSKYQPTSADLSYVGRIHISGSMPTIKEAFPGMKDPKQNPDYIRKRSNHSKDTTPFFVKSIDNNVLYCFQRGRIAWFKFPGSTKEQFIPCWLSAHDFYFPETGKKFFKYNFIDWHMEASMDPFVKDGLIEIWVRKPSLVRFDGQTPIKKAQKKKKINIVSSLSGLERKEGIEKGANAENATEAKVTFKRIKKPQKVRPHVVGQNSIDKALLEKEVRGTFRVIWCERCRGGELDHCPECDGTGFKKVYGAAEPKISNIKLSHRPAAVGSLNIPHGHFKNAEQSSSNGAGDHASIGRSDPLDKSRGMGYSARDNGLYGSIPSYDDFEE